MLAENLVSRPPASDNYKLLQIEDRYQGNRNGASFLQSLFGFEQRQKHQNDIHVSYVYIKLQREGPALQQRSMLGSRQHPHLFTNMV